MLLAAILASLAQAAPSSEEAPAPERDLDFEAPPERPELAVATVRPRRRRSVLPPTRIGMRAGLRPEMNTAFITDFGIQVRRWSKVKLDVAAGVTIPHGLTVPGPLRQLIRADYTAELLYLVGPGLEVGPLLGVSLRTFLQQGTWVGRAVVPIVGARWTMPLVKSRRFAWSLDARGIVDLARVDMVIETREIRALSPLELQMGIRFDFGHGRVRAPERQP